MIIHLRSPEPESPGGGGVEIDRRHLAFRSTVDALAASRLFGVIAGGTG
jgi:hypothetical protein